MRGHPLWKALRPLDNVNLNMNVLISTPGRNSLGAKRGGGAAQEGFHCTCNQMNSANNIIYT